MRRFRFDRESPADSTENKAYQIHRRADNIFLELISKMQSKGEKAGNAKKHIVEELGRIIGGLMPEAPEQVKAFCNKIEALDENDKNFLKQVTEELVLVLAENLSLDELEKRLKNRPTETHQENLSRGLSCEVENNKIILHVPLVFFSNSSEAIESITEGLRVLAEKIKTQEKYEEITEIVGYSDLVKHNHRQISELGFSVTMDAAGEPTDEAKLPKEKFLEIYGK